MTYNSMSVSELMVALVNKVIAMGPTCPVKYVGFPDLESAIRKAVIRESSVGEISIEQHEGYMSPDPLFTVGAKSKLKAGEFYIIPKGD